MKEDARNRSTKKIALLHQLGGLNHGNNACLSAIMRNITSRWPNAQIYGLTDDPDDTQKRHGIPSYAIRQQARSAGDNFARSQASFLEKTKALVGKYGLIVRLLRAINTTTIKVPRAYVREVAFLAKSFLIIRSFDLLVIGTGGQAIEGMFGSQDFPFAIFKWVLIARMARVKCIVLNVDADTSMRSMSKILFRGVLFFADYVAFRDPVSKALAVNLGFHGRAYEFPDSTYSLDIPVSESDKIAKQNGAIVGLAPMSFEDSRSLSRQEHDLYNSYIQQLIEFGAWLVHNHRYPTLFCTHISADPRLIEALERAFETRNDTADSVRRVHQSTHAELLSNMSGMDYVVTSRYYGVVFAHLLNIPVIAISSNPKVKLLMRDLGLSKYCLDIWECDVNALQAAFSALVSDRKDIKSHMTQRLEYYRSQLSRQFDELFP
jgi:polysaccharide pyruvyl transferase WcaK-like protein